VISVRHKVFAFARLCEMSGKWLPNIALKRAEHHARRLERLTLLETCIFILSRAALTVMFNHVSHQVPTCWFTYP
jgi:drug/metabolite transporter superfamily protein YnfA